MRGHGIAQWVNVLKFRNYANNGILALSLPSSFATAKSRSLRLGERMGISREGFILAQQYRHHQEWFHLLDGRTAIIAWLEQYEVQAKPSDPGRIAEQGRVGRRAMGNGLAGRERTLTLLDKIAKSVRRYDSGTIEEYPDRTVGVKEWTDLSASDQADHSLTGERLTSTGSSKQMFLNWVLKSLVQIASSATGIGWTIPARNLSASGVKSFSFPQGSLNFRQTPWQFRVIGPYSVPDFAGGAYGTILALTVFSRRLDSDIPILHTPRGLISLLPMAHPWRLISHFGIDAAGCSVSTRSRSLSSVRQRASQVNASKKKT